LEPTMQKKKVTKSNLAKVELNIVANTVDPVDCVRQKKKVALCKLDRVVIGKHNRVANAVAPVGCAKLKKKVAFGKVR
jgi:hypothetical protein